MLKYSSSCHYFICFLKVNKTAFEIEEPVSSGGKNKTYKFIDEKNGSQFWVDVINLLSSKR